MSTTNVPYADYTAWNDNEYLNEYYADIMSDEQFCLEFLVAALQRISEVPVALDFGSGPIISHILPLVAKAQTVIMSDYLESNRLTVKQWLSNQAKAHNWNPFTQEILRLEGNLSPTAADIQSREQLARQRVTQVLPGDVRDPNPLGLDKRESFPLVTAHYCAEGISPDLDQWRVYMGNIMSMVKPGGTLITSSCGSGTFYKVGEQYFPSTKLEPQDILNCFWENGFIDLDIRVRQLPEYFSAEQGFFYTIFACGVKSGTV
jgi:NNMT/PNMT/TEMT family